MGPKREALRDAGILFLRLLMGLGLALHGYDKLFGGSLPQFTEGVGKLGLPGPAPTLALIAAWSEFGGGLLIMLGLATRLAAAMVFGTMTVAAFVALSGHPFAEKELALLYWTMAATLMLVGAGHLSIDAALQTHFKGGKAS